MLNINSYHFIILLYIMIHQDIIFPNMGVLIITMINQYIFKIKNLILNVLFLIIFSFKFILLKLVVYDQITIINNSFICKISKLCIIYFSEVY